MLKRSTLEFLVENSPQPEDLLKILLKIERPKAPEPYVLNEANYRAIANLGFEKYGQLASTDLAHLGLLVSHRRDIDYINAARRELGLCSLKQLWACRSYTSAGLNDFTAGEAKSICFQHAESTGRVKPQHHRRRMSVREVVRICR